MQPDISCMSFAPCRATTHNPVSCLIGTRRTSHAIMSTCPIQCCGVWWWQWVSDSNQRSPACSALSAPRSSGSRLSVSVGGTMSTLCRRSLRPRTHFDVKELLSLALFHLVREQLLQNFFYLCLLSILGEICCLPGLAVHLDGLWLSHMGGCGVVVQEG